MENLKIRYTWKRKEDGHIYQTISPLECLEGKRDVPFLGNKLWELVNRDFFVKTDKNDKDIFTGDKFVFDFYEVLSEPTILIGSFSWNNDELRYEIDIHENDNYTCLSYAGENGVMRNFELIP